MALKPWYKVVIPRKDLREGRPLDASEFAVHLDQVRDQRAPLDYQNPKRFFDRTYLTRNLTDMAAEVVRRLCGEKTETSAVFNMTTQFGGGKTHALTLLYHLAQNGPSATSWTGVRNILTQAGVSQAPQAATAVFVGTEFDSITGRGGKDGTPLRRTPWGEIAFQLGGETSFAVIAEHERLFTEPKGDVIRAFLPKNRPCLILLDEIVNYVSTYRKMGYHNALYNFIQSLSETARGQDNVVLVVSIPASELEYTAEDEADEQRFKKMLDRLGKAVAMSTEGETSEIIRRRLFEWNANVVPQDGRVLLDHDAQQACHEYADWVLAHRQQLPAWFPIDNAEEAFKTAYPFHPTVLSVFERKWRTLPRFQQTRGILRLLALWVSRAYQEGYKGAHQDPLIGLGTAPLDDPLFRSAVFEQLGEPRLEAAVTTDICGKKDAHALRLDEAAVDTIRKARLHRKVATAVFFESNGGQARAEATLPEIRLSVAEPGLDIGNVETVLEAMRDTCYYLSAEGNRYRFSLTPNLNKLLADRRASLKPQEIQATVCAEVQKVFSCGAPGVTRVFFPKASADVPDRPAITLVILSPDQSFQDHATIQFIEKVTKEHGASARNFKSALIWATPDHHMTLLEEARKLLAWEQIEQEKDELKLDEKQRLELDQNIKKARRDLKESVWRSYNRLILLGKDNALKTIELGLVHSSAADSPVTFMLSRLRQEGDIEDGISPNFLVRNWPPAFREWSTRLVRDTFFASPKFPLLLDPGAVKETIAKGVSNGMLAYVSQPDSDGRYELFYFNTSMSPFDVEISDDMFIITKETAEGYLRAQEEAKSTGEVAQPEGVLATQTDGPSPWNQGAMAHTSKKPPESASTDTGPEVAASADVRALKRMSWQGQVTPQKWMNFYMKVLSRFITSGGLALSVSMEVSRPEGLSQQQIDETKLALRELGLEDHVEIE